MNIIFYIAKNELRKFFYSPIAWLVLTIFIVQLAYGFTLSLDRLLGYDALKSLAFRSNYSGTVLIGRGSDGIFNMIRTSLFIYIPLLSMGLVSRELNTGSYKLLASSPIKVYQIVLGKYLAMLIFSLLFIAIITCFAGIGAVIIQDFQWSLLVPGLVATFLLIACYASIGLYVSSHTSYPLVAGIGTFGLLALLNFSHNLGQDVPVLGELFYWLSMAGRSKQMMSGLLSSSSVAYYLTVALIFIVLTYLSLSQRHRKERFLRARWKYVVAVIFGVLIAYISSRPTLGFYRDFTPMKSETISPQSQQIAARFSEDAVVLKTYVNILSDLAPRSGLPRQQNADFRAFEDWVRFIPQLDIEYIYFYDSIPGNVSVFRDNPGMSMKAIAEKYADAYNIDFQKVLSPAEIRALVDLSEEHHEYVRQIEAKGKKAWLRMYDDRTHYPIEANTASAFNTIVLDVPKIGLVQGHGERSLSGGARGYLNQLNAKASYRFSAANFGFQITPVSMMDTSSIREMDVLLIADPQATYSAKELAYLQEQIDHGKNLVILAEPENKEILDPILTKLNLVLDGDTLRNYEHDYSPLLVFPKLTNEAIQLSKDNGYRKGILTYHFTPTVLHSATMISVDTLASTFRSIPFLSVASGETTGGMEQVIGMALSRKISPAKEQRVVVIGDADFLSNVELGRRLKILTANMSKIVIPLLRWVSYDQFPVYASRDKLVKPKDNTLFLEKPGVDRLRLFLLVLLPCLLLAVSSISLKLRKSK